MTPLPASSSRSMHGRVKSTAVASAEDASAKRAQLAKYAQAKALFLQRRLHRQLDDKSGELTAKLIELNPDFYSLWNLRKDIVLAYVAQQSVHLLAPLASFSRMGLPAHRQCAAAMCRPERKAALCAEELLLAEKGIRRNPKWCAASPPPSLTLLRLPLFPLC